MTNTTEVRFELPEYVTITADEFDGVEATVEYDSNYSDETVTVSGVAEVESPAFDWDTLAVDGRHVRSNGHVFNDDGRHLGTVESATVTVPEEVAIELVTDSVDHDVDRGDDEMIVQTWDTGVMEQEGFMAGTDEIRMERV